MSPVALTLLGSTGSIGCQTLDVVAASRGRIEVVALAAQRSVEALAAQARAVRPRAVAIVDESQAVALRRALPGGVALEVGLEAVAALATEQPADIVLNAITGSVGLGPTLATLDAGRTLALANKESLIVGGDVVLRRARPGQIVPVDSEHSGLAQCLRGGSGNEVERLIITASGGPFRGRSAHDLKDVTPAEALRHPTWSMGPMNSLNSATLMNKGLEVIEAHLLFDIPMDRIEVVVHPQSLVHALVGFRDGSTIAQVSRPDMRLPIALALGWPQRAPEAYGRLDLTAAFDLHFEPVDHEAFPLLGLALRAGARGGIAPAVLNAANEEAAAAFLAGHLRFGEIAEVVRQVLEDQVLGHQAPSGISDSAVQGDFRSDGPKVIGHRIGHEAAAVDQRGAVASTLDLAAVLAAESRAREAARALIKGLKT